jgi:hypothetical protein
MLRHLGFLCLILMMWGLSAHAQTDSTVAEVPLDTIVHTYHAPVSYAQRLLDSVATAERARQQFVEDSLAMVYVQKPDSLRPNKFLNEMLSANLYRGTNFLDLHNKTKSLVREGHTRTTRDPWIIIIILGLMVYTAILNRIVGHDIGNVLQAFYNKRILTQVSKEDSLLNSWAFLGLFLLFGFTFGLFLYQLASYYDVFYSINGIQLFISLSLLIIVLFALKLLILRFIGFVFNINKVVGEYIVILYLTYFNIAFVFLPVALCFSLMSANYIPYLLGVALVMVVVIFIWQYLRSSVSIISNFRFHKFYLFVYLCALEICPILILIKALNIRT